MRVRTAWLVMATALVVACGGGGGGGGPGTDAGGSTGVQGSCEITTPEHACAEYLSGWSTSEIDSFRGSCSGTWSEGECPRAGAVGGCRTTAGPSTYVYWLYDVDAAGARAACEDAGNTWLDP